VLASPEVWGMSNGYDESTLEGYLRDYLRWFLRLVLILGTIGGLAFLAAKPPAPADISKNPQQAPLQGSQQASNPIR
jgi:hypothetical protein